MTYIIAEIGINHNGELEVAKKLIDVAAVAGCNVVKFQKRDPDTCVPEEQKPLLRDTPWGRIPYIEYKHKIEFSKQEYDEIDSHCKSRGIKWTASPWDLESLEFLMEYDIPFIKIASPLLTHSELLEAAVATGKRIIMSTGMSTMEEIRKAVATIRTFGQTDFGRANNNFALLHCNSEYPAPPDQLNLSAIKTLKEEFNCEVGYSGHEWVLGTTIATIYLGATVIERHITLDRKMWGTDQEASVEPRGLIDLVNRCRELESAYGDGIIKVTEGERKAKKKLRIVL